MSTTLLTTIVAATLITLSGTVSAEKCDHCDFYAAPAKSITVPDNAMPTDTDKTRAAKPLPGAKEINKPLFKPTIKLNLGSSGDGRKSKRSGISFGFQPNFNW